MNIKLDKAHQTADELHKVFQSFGNDYDRDKAYAEDIEAQNQPKEKQSKPVMAARTNQVSRTNDGGFESTGQKTGKINNAAIGGESKNLNKSNRSGV